MPLAKLGENIGLTCPLSHELCKKVLSVHSPILFHMCMTSKKYWAPPNIAKGMGHVLRWEWFQKLVHVIS